jgi:hypothetical protein
LKAELALFTIDQTTHPPHPGKSQSQPFEPNPNHI